MQRLRVLWRSISTAVSTRGPLLWLAAIIILVFLVVVAVGQFQGPIRRWLGTHSIGVVSTPSRNSVENQPIGGLNPFPAWHSNNRSSTTSVAWADVDGDGDLDLAVGSSPLQLYLNEADGLQTTPTWTAEDQGSTTGLAWGDVNGDGALDLAVANADAPVRVYLNEGHALRTTASWFAGENGFAKSVAWGDVDGDGDLDLAVGYQSIADAERKCCTVKLYINEGGVLQTTSAWASAEQDQVQSVAWGDVDGDGDLDLAVGGVNAPSRLYQNDGGKLQAKAVWSSDEHDTTRSVAWGDMDSDGDLDLAVGNENGPNRVYENVRGQLRTSAVWSSDEQDATQSVAWGDMDNDGDLDLAVGNGGFDPNRVYFNEGGFLEARATWSSNNEENDTQSVAWGDVDGDGDLDLAVGNKGAQNWVYLNQSSRLPLTASWSSPAQDDTFSVAWGDMNGDGNLDLAVGNVEAPSRVYVTAPDKKSITLDWSSGEKANTQSVAWADVNGDGNLDLTFGNLGASSRIYLNDGGKLQTALDWSPQRMDTTFSVAWGDVDDDGDLDLAVGSGGQIPTRVYLNENGKLQTKAAWSSADRHSTWSVAWGDVDNDGDLDLAVGNRGAPDQVYMNDGGVLQAKAAWSSAESHQTTSIAWGDVDGDGDLDLAVGNRGAPAQLYRNEHGMLLPAAVWSANEIADTRSIAWGDVDGDGDLDLAVGNWDAPNRIYLNEHGMLLPSAVWSSTEVNKTQSVAWGDANGDGALDLAVGNWHGPTLVYLNRQPHYPFYPDGFYAVRIKLQTEAGEDNQRTLTSANGYSVAHIRSGVIPIVYQLFHPSGEAIRAVQAYYSLNGGGSWLPALATRDTITQNLTAKAGTAWSEHVFQWDVSSSHFTGQSDNVIFRLQAMPNLTPIRNRAPGPFQRPFASTQTFPFRVRGAQVRVVDPANQPIANAQVYYRAQNQEDAAAKPIVDPAGQPYRTDDQGYLQGRNLALGNGDHLVALHAITATESYTLYQTSAPPSVDGLTMFTVTKALVQPLVISTKNPLLLFNLDVSLEWDVRKDAKYLSDLTLDLQRASALLYDWTNGQAALGRISVYFNKAAWDTAAIRIHASNRLYPHATLGGVVAQPFMDEPSAVTGRTVVYAPGHVEMPAIWNRHDKANRNLGEDWSRSLTHALSQYLFFLPDNFIGVDKQGKIKLITDCPGVMSDPYTLIRSEYHPAANWLPACADTFSNRQSGRADWATITHFYPWLHQPTGTIDDAAEAGPQALPLAVTQIHFVNGQPGEAIMDVPTFNLRTGDGTPLRASPSARAYLFQTDAQQSMHLLDLGAPLRDQIQAWNARPGDTLCMYDLTAKPTPLAGCQRLTDQATGVTLYQQMDWQPDVALVPQTPQQLTVNLGNVRDDLTLFARLYPLQETGTITGLVPISLTWDATAKRYTGQLNLAQPVEQAYLQIFDKNDAQRSIVIPYTLYATAALPVEKGNILALSSDGQVMLYSAQEQPKEQVTYVLQPATRLPPPPDWAMVVGNAYQVSTTGGAAALDPVAIRMNYAGAEVEPDQANLLHIYFWDNQQWRALPTSVDPAQNVTLAQTQGSGLYVLMYGIQVPLASGGVNLTVYPVAATTTVSDSLHGAPLQIFGQNALGAQTGEPTATCTPVSLLICNR